MTTRTTKGLMWLVLIFGSSLYCSSIHGAEYGELREWKSPSGTFKLKAIFMGVKEGVVKLSKENGEVIDVSLDKLSQADQDYVAKWNSEEDRLRRQLKKLTETNERLRAEIERLKRASHPVVTSPKSQPRPAIAAGPPKKTSLTITAKTKEGAETTITNAKVLLDSNRGYLIGHEFQTFRSIGITDQVAPGNGLAIKKEDVEWERIAKLEWLDKPKDSKHVPGRITFRNGEARDVFLFVHGNNDYINLDVQDVKIEGQMELDGRMRDVSFFDHNLRELVFKDE